MTFTEQDFGAVSLATGAALLAYAVFALARPEPLLRGFKAFPRHRALGLLLTAVGLVWSAFYIHQMSLGELGRYKWTLYLLAPVSFFFIVQYLEDLLAARALGGILMLYPTIMVDSARWIDSPARFLLIVPAYVLVCLGIWLMLSPFKFRLWTEALAAKPALRAASGLIAGALGLALVAAGLLAG